MILEQGILKPIKIAGRQVCLPKTSKQEGISVHRLQQLLQTGQPKICIVRSLGGIGDVLMTTPFVRALKHKWPGSNLTYATDFNYMNGALKDILLYNPDIDELIQYQVANLQEYDLKIDITSVCIQAERAGVKGVKNRIDLFAEYAGVSLEETGFLPTYIVSEQEKQFAKDKLNRYPRRQSRSSYVGIQVRSSSISRSWPLDRVRDLVCQLSQNKNIQIVIFDSSHGYGLKEEWNFPGVISIKDYSIRQVAALINEMDLMITPDSGLMHIAGALNKKIVSIWAGTDPNARINHYPNAIAIARSNYNCHPCWYSSQVCSKNYICMKSITVNEVYQAVINFLNQKDNLIIDNIKTCTPKTQQKNPSELDFCIIRDDGIGDLLNCLPAFSGFRKKYPDKKIGLVTLEKNIGIMQLTNCFDQIIPIQKKWDKITIPCPVFDARDLFEKNQAEDKKGCYFETTTRWSQMAQFLKVEPDFSYKLSQNQNSIEYCKDLLNKQRIDLKDNKIITIQLEATCKTRTWIREYYQPLVKLIDSMGYIPVVLGKNPDDIFDIFHCINLTGKLSTIDFYSIISLSSFFIGVDSGGVHVAAANNVPFVAIYNTILPTLRLQNYKNYEVIFPYDLKCAPCWDKGCQAMTCMKDAIPAIVIQHLKKLIRRIKHGQ